MHKNRCQNCGTELNDCPACKQKLKEKKSIYAPDEHMMAQLQRPTKRGKTDWRTR